MSKTEKPQPKETTIPIHTRVPIPLKEKVLKISEAELRSESNTIYYLLSLGVEAWEQKQKNG
jgi:hypothetical protein